MTLHVKHTDELGETVYSAPWEKMHVEKLSPYVCFTTKEEYWKLYEDYSKCSLFFRKKSSIRLSKTDRYVK